jgi:hypothetical protein
MFAHILACVIRPGHLPIHGFRLGFVACFWGARFTWLLAFTLAWSDHVIF